MWHRLFINLLSSLPPKLIWPFAKKYVAGSSIESGIIISKRLNSEGFLVTADLLGEFIKTIEEGNKTANAYLETIEEFEKANIKGNYSIKPTSFGLLKDKEKCYQNIRMVVELAAKYNNFVRIDMEDSSCTSDEIELYRRLKLEFPNCVGLVIQAYLHRTKEDVKSLIDIHYSEDILNFRLCKGIYKESEKIAYQEPQAIRDNYIDILRYLMENKIYVGIATHDKYLIDKAYSLIEELKVPSHLFEFQMLLGVTPELRNKIRNDGYKLRIYIPFGEEWHAYSMRRLRENPKMVKDIIKAFLH